MPLSGKVAIIAGGGQGIGRACAHRFAQDGASIIIADKEEENGLKVASELKNAGFQAEYIHCNVSERLDVLNLLAGTLEAFNRVDILINAAGIRDAKPFAELTEVEFSSVLDVNLKGAFLLGKAVSKQMIRQLENTPKDATKEAAEPGTIIFITSIQTVLADPNSVAFAVASGGLGQLTKAMAQALAPYAIRVNAIGPSNVMSAVLAEETKTEKKRKKALERSPMGRFGSPPEIAAIAAFLAGSDSSYITGQTIYADGGALSMRCSRSEEDDDLIL